MFTLCTHQPNYTMFLYAMQLIKTKKAGVLLDARLLFLFFQIFYVHSAGEQFIYLLHCVFTVIYITCYTACIRLAVVRIIVVISIISFLLFSYKR